MVKLLLLLFLFSCLTNVIIGGKSKGFFSIRKINPFKVNSKPAPFEDENLASHPNDQEVPQNEILDQKQIIDNFKKYSNLLKENLIYSWENIKQVKKADLILPFQVSLGVSAGLVYLKYWINQFFDRKIIRLDHEDYALVLGSYVNHIENQLLQLIQQNKMIHNPLYQNINYLMTQSFQRVNNIDSLRSYALEIGNDITDILAAIDQCSRQSHRTLSSHEYIFLFYSQQLVTLLSLKQANSYLRHIRNVLLTFLTKFDVLSPSNQRSFRSSSNPLTQIIQSTHSFFLKMFFKSDQFNSSSFAFYDIHNYKISREQAIDLLGKIQYQLSLYPNVINEVSDTLEHISNLDSISTFTNISSKWTLAHNWIENSFTLSAQTLVFLSQNPALDLNQTTISIPSLQFEPQKLHDKILEAVEHPIDRKNAIDLSEVLLTDSAPKAITNIESTHVRINYTSYTNSIEAITQPVREIKLPFPITEVVKYCVSDEREVTGPSISSQNHSFLEALCEMDMIKQRVATPLPWMISPWFSLQIPNISFSSSPFRLWTRYSELLPLPPPTSFFASMLPKSGLRNVSLTQILDMSQTSSPTISSTILSPRIILINYFNSFLKDVPVPITTYWIFEEAKDNSSETIVSVRLLPETSSELIERQHVWLSAWKSSLLSRNLAIFFDHWVNHCHKILHSHQKVQSKYLKPDSDEKTQGVLSLPQFKTYFEENTQRLRAHWRQSAWVLRDLKAKSTEKAITTRLNQLERHLQHIKPRYFTKQTQQLTRRIADIFTTSIFGFLSFQFIQHSKQIYQFLLSGFKQFSIFLQRRFIQPTTTIIRDVFFNQRTPLIDLQQVEDSKKSLQAMIRNYLQANQPKLNQQDREKFAKEMDMSPLSQELENDLKLVINFIFIY